MGIIRKIKPIHVNVVLGAGGLVAGWFLFQYPLKVAFAVVILMAMAFIGTLIIEDNEYEAREKTE